MCGSNKDVVGSGDGLLCEACAESNRVGSRLTTTSTEVPVNISVMRVHPLAKFVDIDGTVKPPSLADRESVEPQWCQNQDHPQGSACVSHRRKLVVRALAV